MPTACAHDIPGSLHQPHCTRIEKHKLSRSCTEHEPASGRLMTSHSSHLYIHRCFLILRTWLCPMQLSAMVRGPWSASLKASGLDRRNGVQRGGNCRRPIFGVWGRFLHSSLQTERRHAASRQSRNFAIQPSGSRCAKRARCPAYFHQLESKAWSQHILPHGAPVRTISFPTSRV